MFRIITALLCAAVVLPCASAQSYRGLVGGEVEIGEGNRSRALVDIGKTFRYPQPPDPMPPLDENGWPMTDWTALYFDLRPYAAWLGEATIDDPERFIPDWSGTYKLSFQGQATIEASHQPVVIANQLYDAASNTTTADVTVPPGTSLMGLRFTGTKRNPDSAVGTGITGIRLIRPGYPADGSKIFTDEFIASLEPYSFLRFMGVLDTNGADADYDKAKPLAENQKRWSDRHVPADATQQTMGRKRGLAWEYVIALANQTGKDIWINIPVSADDDYIRQLATLMRDTLKPGIRIYVEHGNEVWNGIFTTYKWNRAATDAEISSGGSKLDLNPPAQPIGWVAKQDVLAQRRHARRLAEIGQIFVSVFGQDALHTIVRPVLAGWIELPRMYTDSLSWVKNNVGDPAKLYYAVAQTRYYNDQQARVAGATVEQVLNAMRASSDAGLGAYDQMRNLASEYGLKVIAYEGGPDIGGRGMDVDNKGIGNDTPTAKIPGLASAINACRDARMKDLVLHDMRTNWFARGGQEYNYFTISGGVSRWGCWGAVEDVAGPKSNSPKLDAILELTGGRMAAPVITAVVNAASGQEAIAPGGFATIYGDNFTDAAYDFWGSRVAGGRLPAVVGGVAVRVGGKDAVISYAGPKQVNIIVPDGVSGQLDIAVTGRGGTVSATVKVSEHAPGLFGSQLGGSFQLSALFAGTSIYVAPEGAWPGVTSRPAKPGDELELYATGLGPSGAPFGQVLTQQFSIDPSEVSVTVGGVPADVAWAGMTYAGVYQVNIKVPAITTSGNLPVVLTIGGKSSQGQGSLTFEN